MRKRITVGCISHTKEMEITSQLALRVEVQRGEAQPNGLPGKHLKKLNSGETPGLAFLRRRLKKLNTNDLLGGFHNR